MSKTMNQEHAEVANAFLDAIEPEAKEIDSRPTLQLAYYAVKYLLADIGGGWAFNGPRPGSENDAARAALDALFAGDEEER